MSHLLNYPPHPHLSPQGFVALSLAVILQTSSAAPAPFFDPASLAFTAAGGLVLTAGANTFTIPTVALLAGKAIAIKGLLLSSLGAASR